MNNPLSLFLVFYCNGPFIATPYFGLGLICVVQATNGPYGMSTITVSRQLSVAFVPYSNQSVNQK